MIYITGDTHGQVISLENFKALSDKDIVIICGDFGFIWNNSTLENQVLDSIQEDFKCTFAFIDGNHENFHLLKKYPIRNWNRGKVQQIRKNIFHLMRGEIYVIENKSFFCMGGACSIDKENRLSGISWWKEEEPNFQEIENGFSNLDKYNWKVDYILTHDLPQSIIDKNFPFMSSDSTRRMLNYFDKNINFKVWYAGHHHQDVLLSEKHRIVYDDVLSPGEL